MKAFEFCSTFWHSNWHNFGYISGRLAKPHFLESPQKSKQADKQAIFEFLPFSLFQISNDYCQKSYNGLQVFLESSKYFWSTHFCQSNSSPFNFFEICTEMYFVCLFFLKENKLHKQAILKFHAVEYGVAFFSISYISLF